jgi:hypothetical protein
MQNRQMSYRFRAEVWKYPGKTGSWYFVTLPKTYSVEIKKRFAGIRRGFGSIRVIAETGRTSWQTSIFPDTREGSFILPIKAVVRKKEGIQQGNTVAFRLRA